MTAVQWFTVIQSVVMSLATLIAVLIYRGFQTGRWTEQIDKSREISDLNQRMDRAGKAMSDLASDVQALDHRFREIFVDQKVFDVVISDVKSRTEGNRLEIERIWSVVRMRGMGNRQK